MTNCLEQINSLKFNESEHYYPGDIIVTQTGEVQMAVRMQGMTVFLPCDLGVVIAYRRLKYDKFMTSAALLKARAKICLNKAIVWRKAPEALNKYAERCRMLKCAASKIVEFAKRYDGVKEEK